MSDLAVQNRESEQEVMPSFDFLLERETERNTLLAEHRAWLKEIKRERPLPKTHYRVAVYIRYFNQTRYEDYLSAHKSNFLIHWLSAQTGSLSVSMWTRAALRPIWRTLRSGQGSFKTATRKRSI